ncbi:hypothetical protein RB195_024959 [Necator americanus]|uniref:Nanos RNA binding domain protein n=1 Tax=Necator americanus TaxID=51031 RepID=A0ABR1EQA3_NECAM
MVNEVADPSNDDEPVKTRRVHDDSPRDPSVFDRASQLGDKITQMERDLEYFPFTDPGDRCAGLQTTMRCAFCDAEGEHFSDACPMFRSGDERFDITRAKRWCTFCIGDCPRNVPCRLRERQCWYCTRVKDTIFAALRPRDNGHHRSLCNVPDKRHLARERLVNAKEELRRLRRKCEGPSTSRE